MRITIEIDGMPVGTFTDQAPAGTATAGRPPVAPIGAGAPILPGSSESAAPVRPPAELLAAAAAQGAFNGGPAPVLANPNRVHTASTDDPAIPAAAPTATDHPAGQAPIEPEPTTNAT